jgi:acyl transferase domain-containing protein
LVIYIKGQRIAPLAYICIPESIGGQRNWRGKNIGCFVGVFGEDWLEMSTKDVQVIDTLHAMSTRDFVLANRLSYEYDLQGPRYF